MSSHFACLGFPIGTEAELQALAEHAAHEGQVVPVPGGAYVRWSPGGGVELWLQVVGSPEQGNGEVVGLTPFFQPEVPLVLGLVDAVDAPAEAPFDGGYRAIVAPDPERMDGGATLILDLADARRYHDLPLPVRAEVALAGFAHQLVGYASEGAFRLAQPEFKLAFGRFDALGPPPDAPQGTPPPAMVRWTGQVLAAEQRHNAFTGQPYQWARLRVPGAEVEVVAPPDLVEGTPLAPGGVADGIFWVCGRVLRTV